MLQRYLIKYDPRVLLYGHCLLDNKDIRLYFFFFFFFLSINMTNLIISFTFWWGAPNSLFSYIYLQVIFLKQTFNFLRKMTPTTHALLDRFTSCLPLDKVSLGRLSCWAKRQGSSSKV